MRFHCSLAACSDPGTLYWRLGFCNQVRGEREGIPDWMPRQAGLGLHPLHEQDAARMPAPSWGLSLTLTRYSPSLHLQCLT